MYEIEVIEKLDSGHILDLPYESKCSNIHGHRWLVKVKIAADKLNKVGMVIDFTHVKAVLKNYDHKFFIHSAHKLAAAIVTTGAQDSCAFGFYQGVVTLPFQPTAENLAAFFYEKIKDLMMNQFAEMYPDDHALRGDVKGGVVSVELWETESGRVIYKP